MCDGAFLVVFELGIANKKRVRWDIVTLRCATELPGVRG